ncbi:MAG TPA: prephenate dehydratase [Bacilli bacterium]
MKRIAFLGPEGTVSEMSTRYFFAGEPHEFISYRLINDVFAATASGETDLSVIPIENTIDGSVSLHLDLLVHEVDLPIQAEWIYPSVQNLIGFQNPTGLNEWTHDSDEKFSHIHKIVSINVAIAQCRHFLKEHLPNVEFEYVSSTAEGVSIVKQKADPGIAAIGHALAAEKYGLELLAEDITDHHNNFTRFILIGNHPPALKETGKRKTTVLVTLPEDYPGALHQVLSAFQWRRINLSKIESRPTKKKLGNYYFYIDIEASLNSVLLPAAISEIEAIGCQVRILGSYPCYTYEEKVDPTG